MRKEERTIYPELKHIYPHFETPVLKTLGSIYRLLDIKKKY